MKFNINPFYTFLYKTVAKFIGVVLLFLLGAYVYTAGFFGCIILSLFFPNEYLKVKDYFDNTLERKSKYDLYILLKPDCESIQDGTRKFLDDRWKHYQIIKDNLIERECNFIEIGGDWDNRFNQSKKIISELL